MVLSAIMRFGTGARYGEPDAKLILYIPRTVRVDHGIFMCDVGEQHNFIVLPTLIHNQSSLGSFQSSSLRL